MISALHHPSHAGQHKTQQRPVQRGTNSALNSIHLWEQQLFVCAMELSRSFRMRDGNCSQAVWAVILLDAWGIPFYNTI